MKSVSFVSWHAIVDGMDFQLELGFYSYASNAAFWCFRFWSFCNKNPKPFMLKLPSAVPLDLLIFELLVLSCIFSVFLSAGIARSPTASVGRLFSPHCPEYFVEDRKRSLSFSCAGRLAVTRVSDASFSSYHDVAHPAVQVVCSTQKRVTRQSVWRPFFARDSEWNGPSIGSGFL